MNPTTKLDSRYLAMVLDVVSQGIFTINSVGTITYFNKAAARITGYREEEVLGRPCHEVLRADICGANCPLKQSIKTRREINDSRHTITAKDGRSIPIQLTAAPLETQTGKLIGGVQVFNDISHLEKLKRKLDERYRFDDIISKNSRMQSIFDILPQVAESASTVLITGESGTGKELIAKAVHSHSPRRDAPFIAVNCAAMPESLLESELFGYKKGAFTDAKQNKPGRIAAAEGGTLFLDEVGDLAKPLQVKILRFLQERMYEPLGGTLSVKSDVRVIAATNRDLGAMVSEGTMREDLYYRLNVMEINLPPLRHRSDDIPQLVDHFIHHFNSITGRAIDGIEERALAILMHYPFPGNIRELENLIERAFILCSGNRIAVENLPEVVRNSVIKQQAEQSRGSRIRSMEIETIREALNKHNGNRSKAADELGIHRVTLLRKMKKYELD
jgi:PAS domain S-box-containing protein